MVRPGENKVIDKKLLTYLLVCVIVLSQSEKAKPIARWRRKATGLREAEIAGLPEEVTRFFYAEGRVKRFPGKKYKSRRVGT